MRFRDAKVLGEEVEGGIRVTNDHLQLLTSTGCRDGGVVFDVGCRVSIEGNHVFVESRVCTGAESMPWGTPGCYDERRVTCDIPPLEPGVYTIHIDDNSAEDMTMVVELPFTYPKDRIPRILPWPGDVR